MNPLNFSTLTLVTRHLPDFPFSVAVTTGINFALWKQQNIQSWQDLCGRHFCLHVQDLGLKAHFSVTPYGILPMVRSLAEVTLTASSRDFLRLALHLEDPDTLFFNRRLLIEGDTNLGLMVKNKLDNILIEEGFLATLKNILQAR